jgi:hypothetical protein
MDETPTKPTISILDLDASEDVETLRGRAYTVSLATVGVSTEMLMNELSDCNYNEARAVLEKYFTLT